MKQLHIYFFLFWPFINIFSLLFYFLLTCIFLCCQWLSMTVLNPLTTLVRTFILSGYMILEHLAHFSWEILTSGKFFQTPTTPYPSRGWRSLVLSIYFGLELLKVYYGLRLTLHASRSGPWALSYSSLDP